MKINKDKIRELIGSGKTEYAIKELLSVTVKVDEATHSQVTNLQGQYSKLKSEEIAGILSTDESNRRLAKINRSLLTIIIVLPDNYPNTPKKDDSGESTTGTGTPQSPNNTTAAPNSNNHSGQPLNALNYVLLFLLLLILSIGTLALLAAGNYTQDRFLQYCVLVILGLVVGTFTHGVMNSRSRLEGRKSGFVLQLGGPIVACLLVVVGGYYFLNTDRAKEVPTETQVSGCMDKCALNYDSKANQDDGSCNLPTKPNTLCYETAVFDTSTCKWKISGEKPRKSTNLKCYQTATFNDRTCNWEITGNEPNKPDLKCYQTLTLGTNCQWQISGNKPEKPANLKCYQTVTTFNSNTCDWEVVGRQPDKPQTGIRKRAIFNESTCEWDIRDRITTVIDTRAVDKTPLVQVNPPSEVSFSIISDDFTIGSVKIGDKIYEGLGQVKIHNLYEGTYTIEIMNRWGEVKSTCTDFEIEKGLKKIMTSCEAYYY